MWGWLRENLSLAPRSVYLHNNKLADAGLPDNMFNGSSNVEILILSSNFLRHVPKHLPPALYKLHLKVGGRGQGGALPEQGESPGPHGHSREAAGPRHELGGTESTAEKQTETQTPGRQSHTKSFRPGPSPHGSPRPLSISHLKAVSLPLGCPSCSLSHPPTHLSEQQAGEDPTRCLQRAEQPA